MTDAADDAGVEREMIDAALVIGNAVCNMTSSRIESYEDQKLVVTLTEDGLEEYIRELRLEDHLAESKEWLESQK